jgi:citrate lyase subunit beta/citryl-CoA lyase
MKVNGVNIRRSYLEVPTMDSHKWSKIPSIQADVFMADMEDSVPTALKDQARDKVVELVRDPRYFGGREFICRPNNLGTPWGRDDLEALAEARAPFLMYPKVRYAGELLEVNRIFDRHGATTEIAVLIETPEAVLHVEELAACPMVSCLMFGPGDLAMETGISLINGRMPFTEGMLYARSKTLLAARAYGLEAVEGIFVSDLKDLETVRESLRLSKLMGYTGTICFYPPWVPVINEIRTPSREDIQWSQKVVDAYEAGLEKGQAAVTVDGKWLTIHQYRLAKDELKVAHALGLA